MNKQKKVLCQAFCIIALSNALFACQAVPEKKAGVDVIDGQHIEQVSADLKVVMEKQKQHDQLLQEWQALKPALSRLVVIEEELNLMINQLDQFAAASAKPSAQPAETVLKPAALQTTDGPKPAEKQPVILANNNTEKDTEKRFALQITSLSEPLRLPVVWEQLKKKHPQQLAALEPNYEKISVGNSDYYRLKIGAYSSKQQAMQSCSMLKGLGINCLVTNYVASDFSLLPRP